MKRVVTQKFLHSLVLDTNVVISALLWYGAPTRLLEMVEEDMIQLFTSHTLIDELSGILLHARKLATPIRKTGFTAEEMIVEYQRITTVITAHKLTQKVCRDADDDAVLACALAAKADMVISGDKDLLVLHPFKNIPIIKPAEAVKQLQKLKL
jgi:uncharacterized protein